MNPKFDQYEITFYTLDYEVVSVTFTGSPTLFMSVLCFSSSLIENFRTRNKEPKNINLFG